MNVIVGDLTKVKNDGVIVHQVNCQGAMGSGVARALMGTFPTLKKQYLDFCSKHTPEELLGKVLLIQCQNKYTGQSHWIANLFGQLNYGRDSNVLYTDYSALAQGLASLSNSVLLETSSPRYYLPYGMGAGLANGDWNYIELIISNTLIGEVNLIKL